MNTAQIIQAIDELILTGGRRTTAANVRSLLNDFVSSYPNTTDGGNVFVAEVGYTSDLAIADDFSFVHKKWVLDNAGSDLSGLTNGYIPYYDGTNLANSNLIHNTLFTSLKDTTYLQSENGLTTLNFNDGNGFALDWSDVNSGGIFADNGKTQVYHSDIVDINATIVKIRKNLITSGTTDKTWIEFFTGDSCRITTDGGARNEGWLELTTTNAGLFFAGYGIEIDANRVEISHDTQITFNSPLYTFPQLNDSNVPYLDSNKNLVSSTITPTELGYLSGASSNLQSQISGLVAGVSSWKDTCVVATTGNVTLSGEQTIDGELTNVTRILVWMQTNPIENGIYVTGPGAWTRATDFDNNTDKISGASTVIQKGTLYANHEFICSSDAPVVVGTDAINFIDYLASYIGTTNRINVTGNVIDISATFEALLGKVASPLSQFASTTSAELASIISDETGSGSLVFGTAPTLSNPVVGTQSSGDNSTKAASTAFVVEARAIFDYYSDTSTNTPGDNGTFYSGTLNNYAAETTTTYSFQSPKTNTIFKGTMWAEVRGTLGTTEDSVIKLKNITQGTEETLGNLKHSRRLNYLAFTSTLANTVGDEMIFQGTNPAWSTNPTAVHYSWNIKGY